jgi:hypothetical protein
LASWQDTEGIKLSTWVDGHPQAKVASSEIPSWYGTLRACGHALPAPVAELLIDFYNLSFDFHGFLLIKYVLILTSSKPN